ncbi:MAG: hypothetical protein Q4B01_01445 [Eubacteriales bacterium]|nr:hypothetical protein [Eubacteriales bacterium]
MLALACCGILSISSVSTAFSADLSEESTSLFFELSEYTFTFASGAGAWYTELEIHEDGTFSGNFHNTGMGDRGEGYDYSVYECSYNGTLSDPVKIDDHCFYVQASSLNLDVPDGTEEIRERVRHVSDMPYGLSDAEEMYICLPGCSTEHIPENAGEFFPEKSRVNGVITHPLIYMAASSTVFKGYVSHIEEETAGGNISAERGLVQEAEETARELRDQIYAAKDDQTKADLYETLYMHWDAVLNELWGRLAERLDAEQMDHLTEEELVWIANKESICRQIEAGCVDVRNGQLQSNMFAAEETRSRVYILLKYFE